MTQSIPPGWYREPSDVSMLRYWNGQGWTVHRAPAPPSVPASNNGVSRLVAKYPATVILTTFAIGVFLLALAQDWRAALVLALLAPLVGVPAGLIALAVRSAKLQREHRERTRRYQAGLAARADQEHQAILRGDLDAGVFGAFQPDLSIQPPQLPDAEEMRRSAWQPDLPDQQPVRPADPAAWHVVTQWPTRQFQKGDSR
ncbi:DUF2510 domain-containing protein [Mycobacterium marinum]|uniref:DUF2510 domain-containing protein n=1 Tax=Mycobacterium marinum TaxID=1781 RepID=UPI0021C41FB5|nr:DUF2510 domain-containing protein [Mycobacterium marinum]